VKNIHEKLVEICFHRNLGYNEYRRLCDVLVMFPSLSEEQFLQLWNSIADEVFK
jgi:hypothetical protein